MFKSRNFSPNSLPASQACLEGTHLTAHYEFLDAVGGAGEVEISVLELLTGTDGMYTSQKTEALKIGCLSLICT